MSEYQYYEFCKLNKPLTADTRQKMYSLSSRAKVTTHGASYVYNYGDFRGNPEELLLKHFDVFFYISNWGRIQLMFKYNLQEVDIDKMKKYCVKHVINCKTVGSYAILDIDFSNEDGFGWIEGDGILADLLPLYDEIKFGNYQLLKMIANISNETANNISANDINLALSEAQEAFFKHAEIDHNMFYE